MFLRRADADRSGRWPFPDQLIIQPVNVVVSRMVEEAQPKNFLNSEPHLIGHSQLSRKYSMSGLVTVKLIKSAGVVLLLTVHPSLRYPALHNFKRANERTTC